MQGSLQDGRARDWNRHREESSYAIGVWVPRLSVSLIPFGFLGEAAHLFPLNAKGCSMVVHLIFSCFGDPVSRYGSPRLGSSVLGLVWVSVSALRHRVMGTCQDCSDTRGFSDNATGECRERCERNLIATASRPVPPAWPDRLPKQPRLGRCRRQLRGRSSARPGHEIGTGWWRATSA